LAVWLSRTGASIVVDGRREIVCTPAGAVARRAEPFPLCNVTASHIRPGRVLVAGTRDGEFVRWDIPSAEAGRIAHTPLARPRAGIPADRALPGWLIYLRHRAEAGDDRTGPVLESGRGGTIPRPDR